MTGRGREVNLTNVQASLYGGGTGVGWSYFDWRKRQGTVTTFKLAVTNVNLNTLVSGLSRTNTTVEGKLDGEALITGNCLYDESWHGEGSLDVHDAMLWDIPIFGKIVSPVLNTLQSGWGNNRGHDAHGTFVLTNGMLRTEDMSVRASKGLTLLYRGGVNLTTVDLRVEGRMLHDLGLPGPVYFFCDQPRVQNLRVACHGPDRQSGFQALLLHGFAPGLPAPSGALD